MPEIDVPGFGPVRYSDDGDGPVVVLLHGLFADSRLWRDVVPQLAGACRVVAPDLPLGAHVRPLRDRSAASPEGIARLVAGLLDALDLQDVTLAGSDTGGVIAQIVATRHPERLARLILFPTDAYDNFLPVIFRPLQWGARLPERVFLGLVQPLRLRAVRKAPFAFGWLSKRGVPREVEAEWVRPFFSDPGVRGDTIAFLRAIDPAITQRAARELESFDRPALVAWATDDKVFPFAHAERLAAALPQGRLERIHDSRTFVSIDAPQRTAELIRGFAG